MQIVDNVHLIPGVVANPYLLVDPDGLTLIDAGMPGSQRRILACVAGLGRSARDLKRILITHSDMDHVGGLAALLKASGARTYTSKIEAEAIAAGTGSRPPSASDSLLRRLMRALMRSAPVRVDEVVSDGQVLPVLGGLQVVETPGHTPGHVSFFAPAAGVLFCGDSMISDERGLHGSRPGLTWDDAKARESERRQAGLGASIVCPGHGPVVREAGGKFPTG
jgi:glyoxylase-like metal-dependent hydrolase (beta-lactamase superfamily II)